MEKQKERERIQEKEREREKESLQALEKEKEPLLALQREEEGCRALLERMGLQGRDLEVLEEGKLPPWAGK